MLFPYLETVKFFSIFLPNIMMSASQNVPINVQLGTLNYLEMKLLGHRTTLVFTKS